MKTKLFSLLVALFIITSCSNSNNTSVHKNNEPTTKKIRTAKEALINDGWTELATVCAYTEKEIEDNCEFGEFFRIFYKGEHYVAIDESIITGMRYSVSKGNYRKCGETYSGRISRAGKYLYFNF